MKIALVILISSVAALTSCSFNIGTGNSAAKSDQPANASPAASSSNSNSQPAANASQAAATPAKATGACKEEGLAGKNYIKSQSFPIDFKPFSGGCFVTFGSKSDMLDEKDVPRGSTFYVYKDGKQVFEFPDAFGGQPACWVEAVSFKDLNGDGLTDIILAGSCLAAKSSYPSNAIYVNTGSAFTTDDDANSKLQEMKSVKEIEAYVKGHTGEFF